MESADLCAVYCNPIQVPVADPVIYYEAGTYYLYGTWDVDSLTGIAVHTSRDLVHWQWQGFAFRKTETTHGQRNFWGAEVIKHGEEYLLYYCASPNREDTLPLNMAIYVAKGKSPLGPFKEWKAPLYAANESDEAIDQNFFLDEDGTPWLYFVRVTRMHNEIWVAKLSQDLGAFEGEPTLCIRSEAGAWDSRPWEGHRVAEGPLVFKRNGVYCLEYTGNHFLDPDYAIGFATADTPRGPWKRYDGNPVLSRSDKVFGPGNACIVPSPDGTEEFIVYHIHQSPRTPQPRYLAIDRIRIKAEPGGKMSFSVEGPTHTPQVLPAGAAARPYAVSDDFTGASLVRKQWSVLHEDPDNWYYEKGDLVIQTQAGDCWKKRADFHNLFLQYAPLQPFQILLHLTFQPTENYQQAFLTLWQDYDNYIRVSRVYDQQLEIVSAQEIEGVYTENKIPDSFGNTFFLRITADGTHAVCAISSDGTQWSTIHKYAYEFSLPRIGFCAISPGTTCSEEGCFHSFEIIQ